MNRINYFDINTTTSWLPFIPSKSHKNNILSSTDWLSSLPIANDTFIPIAGKSNKKKEVFKQRRRGVGIPTPKKNMGWVLYGSKQCPFCVDAKTWFDYHNIPVHYYDVDELIANKFIDSREDLFVRLGEERIRDQKTIPVIFYNGELVGGYTDLILWAKQNPSQMKKMSKNPDVFMTTQ